LPQLWVMPTEALGRSWSQTRWQEFVRTNPVLAAHMPDDPDEFKLLEMHFDRFTMNVVGSNSPANVASRPVGIVNQDEVCKFREATESESSTMKLADQRTKTFPRAFRGKASTPTIPEHEFWQDFLAGDQRYYWMPCPHPECGQELKFEHSRATLVWDPEAKTADGLWDLAKVQQTAHYVCPHCGGEIWDKHKPSMLLKGRWVPSNPAAAAGRRSYHLNSFYSPDVTFGTMAVKFLEGQDLFGLQDYYNGWLAIPWTTYEENVKQEKVLNIRSDKYRVKQIPYAPEELAYVAIESDPGLHRTHWGAIATSITGEMSLIDYGTTLALEDVIRLFHDLEWKYRDSSDHVQAQMGLMDSGDFTMRVYDACAASNGLIWPSKGSDASTGAWNQSLIKTHPSLVLYTYVDYTAKFQIYVDAISKRLPPLVWLPQDVSIDVINGCSGQQLLVKRTPRGVMRYFKPLPEDHYGDILKLGRVNWWVMRQHFQEDLTSSESGGVEQQGSSPGS
jgi:phage terminase large subunit GpA-like protein